VIPFAPKFEVQGVVYAKYIHYTWYECSEQPLTRLIPKVM
jgi:hypothetical protein